MRGSDEGKNAPSKLNQERSPLFVTWYTPWASVCMSLPMISARFFAYVGVTT